MINTIRCGQDGDTARAWQQIAIARPRRVLDDPAGRRRPADRDAVRRQARRSSRARIDATTVVYGDASARRAYEGKMAVAAAAPAPAKADRARVLRARAAAWRAPTRTSSRGVATGCDERRRARRQQAPERHARQVARPSSRPRLAERASEARDGPEGDRGAGEAARGVPRDQRARAEDGFDGSREVDPREAAQVAVTATTGQHRAMSPPMQFQSWG